MMLFCGSSSKLQTILWFSDYNGISFKEKRLSKESLYVE